MESQKVDTPNLLHRAETGLVLAEEVLEVDEAVQDVGHVLHHPEVVVRGSTYFLQIGYGTGLVPVQILQFRYGSAIEPCKPSLGGSNGFGRVWRV